MRPAYKCKWHKDDTPSLKLMSYGWFCFGCGKRPTGPEMERAYGEGAKNEDYDCEDQEDLEATYRYIESLPKKELRGLHFHADERSYYITWPDKSYYKRRLFSEGKRGKYLSPRGHKPKLFWAKRDWEQNLMIVEGEINALSLAEVATGYDICSFGSASNFTDSNFNRALPEFQKYSKLIVVVDNDSAGIKALITARASLLYKVPFVNSVLMSKDANDVLCERGREGLREELLRYCARS